MSNVCMVESIFVKKFSVRHVVLNDWHVSIL